MLASPLAAACGGQPAPPASSQSRQAVTLRWSTWGNENNPMVQGAAQGIKLFRQKLPHVSVGAEPWLEIATSVVGHQPSRKSWQDKFVALSKKTCPALANKDLDAFVEPIKGNYARPEQFFLKDNESKKIWSDAVAATFTCNEAMVSDTSRKAAGQINQLHQP